MNNKVLHHTLHTFVTEELNNQSENVHLNRKNSNLCIFDGVVDMNNILAGGCYGYCCDCVSRRIINIPMFNM